MGGPSTRRITVRDFWHHRSILAGDSSHGSVPRHSVILARVSP
ncbi:hypothetical protein [Luteibacter sp.]